MYPKGTQKYVAPSYSDITDEKMRNYKKILHQSQWEVQSKLSVIKVRKKMPPIHDDDHACRAYLFQ